MRVVCLGVGGIFPGIQLWRMSCRTRTRVRSVRPMTWRSPARGTETNSQRSPRPLGRFKSETAAATENAICPGLFPGPLGCLAFSSLGFQRSAVRRRLLRVSCLRWRALEFGLGNTDNRQPAQFLHTYQNTHSPWQQEEPGGVRFCAGAGLAKPETR